MQKVKEAAQTKLAVAALSAVLSVVGTWVLTEYPDVHRAFCERGAALWTLS